MVVRYVSTAPSSDGDRETSRYRLLWLTVVLSAIEEAENRPVLYHGRCPERFRLEQEARDWIASERFGIICGMAGIETGGVEELKRRFL